MRRYAPELILASVLLVLVMAVSYWEAPGHPLTADEVDRMVGQFERLAPMPAADKAMMVPHLRAWALSDDGKPFHMLNLLNYHPSLTPWPGTTVNADSPRAANAFYEDATVALALPKGLSMTYAGEPMGTADSIQLTGSGVELNKLGRVLVVRYPSRRAFLSLISDPNYHKVMPYKFAALDVTLIPMRSETITPDLRLIVGALSLIALLGFGWWRASRR